MTKLIIIIHIKHMSNQLNAELFEIQTRGIMFF